MGGIIGQKTEGKVCSGEIIENKEVDFRYSSSPFTFFYTKSLRLSVNSWLNKTIDYISDVIIFT